MMSVWAEGGRGWTELFHGVKVGGTGARGGEGGELCVVCVRDRVALPLREAKQGSDMAG